MKKKPITLKVNAPADTEASQNLNKQSYSNSTAAQRQRLLQELRHGSVSTIQARRDLDIMMPGARIFELKHKEGYDIQTVLVEEETEAGNLHRVARYILKSATNKNMPENGGDKDCVKFIRLAR